MNAHWHIHIDTGGTFTDCLAFSPGGATLRIKVLSTGCLRATVGERLDASYYRLIHTWPVREPIFAGYQLRLMGLPGAPFTVKDLDPVSGRLVLDRSLPATLLLPLEVELRAGEEAPILAARLATGTPLHQALPPLRMRLGTTRGTNALLEGKGANVALLINQGLEDALSIGTQQRPELFALNIQKRRMLYAQVWGVACRHDAQGQAIQALTETEVDQLVQSLKGQGAEAVAIALMHSYRNPEAEQQLKAACLAAGIPYVSASAELAPAIKLLPRAETAVVNAYLSPIMEEYLAGVKAPLGTDSRLHIMSSAGGLVRATHFHPKDSLLSGPAGGVVGAAAMALRSGVDKILTLDMGGTSTDVARFAGTFDYRYETQVGEAHLLSPCLAIETVAAGGGSICRFDGQKLSVGPESAGADPGPACYGAGGPLTLTDVNLLLGRLDPDRFRIPVHTDAAAAALDRMVQDTGMEPQAVLSGLLQIANEKMAEAIRSISVREGYDPKAFALLAFGGAGGQHACQVARLLGMKRVLVPYDAGLLSAYGMLMGKLERVVSQQVLEPLSAAAERLPARVQTLTEAAISQLSREEEIEPRQVHCRVVLGLRFIGQEQALDIPYSSPEDMLPRFRAQYEKIFGHWLEDRPIEWVNIRVFAEGVGEQGEERAAAPEDYLPSPHKTVRGWAVYHWENLLPGARLEGPALVLNDTSTTVVEAGWSWYQDGHRTAHLAQIEDTVAVAPAGQEEADPVHLELFTNRFRAIATEMGALLERTALSVNVRERLDFSCALLDPAGRLVVNAPHIPVHLGSLGVCTRRVHQHLHLGPGDVAITNHPAFGGSHLPDITLIAPVYDPQGLHLGFVANRAHHAEIGGARPGSMPPQATRLIEEGAVISPTWLIRTGEAQWEAMKALLTEGPYPTRALEENLADLRAALASITRGRDSLQALAAQAGSEQVVRYMEALRAYSRQKAQAALSALPEGQYTAAEQMDDGTPIQVTMTLADGRMAIDFAGSGPVHPGNLNANISIVSSAVLYVLRLLIDAPIPLNEGIMEQVSLALPACFLHPPFSDDPAECPAVVGGNIETSQRLVDTLLKALGLAACSQGTMNNLLFGNEAFGYYETLGAGTGAGPGFDGADAVHQHMTNTRITDPEILEWRYPVRVQVFSVRRGSGGAGRWRGGDGIRRKLLFLEPVELTVLTQHRVVAPYGAAGGAPGALGRQWIEKASGAVQPLAGIDGARLEAGDAIVMETPGGGGWGMP